MSKTSNGSIDTSQSYLSFSERLLYLVVVFDLPLPLIVAMNQLDMWLNMKCNSKTVNTEAISNRAPTVEIARLEQDYPTWALIVWLTASDFGHSLEVKE